MRKKQGPDFNKIRYEASDYGDFMYWLGVLGDLRTNIFPNMFLNAISPEYEKVDYAWLYAVPITIARWGTNSYDLITAEKEVVSEKIKSTFRLPEPRPSDTGDYNPYEDSFKMDFVTIIEEKLTLTRDELEIQEALRIAGFNCKLASKVQLVFYRFLGLWETTVQFENMFIPLGTFEHMRAFATKCKDTRYLSTVWASV